MGYQSFSRDFVTFLKNEKKWWMIPLGVVVLLLVGLALLTRTSAAGPFLYPIL
jgi:drug/metabolite transporter superfamily protein YnfA